MNAITTQLPFLGVMTSSIGGRKENQDSCGYSDTSRGLLLVVCDGMGGGPGGKTASSIAATTIIAHVQQAHPAENATAQDNADLLKEAIKAANRALRDKILECPELDGMGTTAVVALLNTCGAALAHVGDSRIYQLRKQKMAFRTADHSRVGEMVRAGVLTEEQARLSAISNIITRALGIGDEVQVDTNVVSFQKGDRFVLCTDGVWGAMPEPELIKLFTNNRSLDTSINTINTEVEVAGQAKGGRHDNFTIIMAECKENSASVAAPKPPKPVVAPVKKPEGKPASAEPAQRRPFNGSLLALIISGAVIVTLGIVLLFTRPASNTDGDGGEGNTTPADSLTTEVDSSKVTQAGVTTVVSNSEILGGNGAAPDDKGNKGKESKTTGPKTTENAASTANNTQQENTTTGKAEKVTADAPMSPELKALCDTIGQLRDISDQLAQLKTFLTSMGKQFKKNGEFKADKAKGQFMSDKAKTVDLLKKLNNLPKSIFTQQEQDWLFKLGDGKNIRNGVYYAVGIDADKETQPDLGGCEWAIKYTNNAKSSIDARIEALEAKKKELEK